jgi:hypothetical protein
MDINIELLSIAIEKAAKSAFMKLFANKERYYYCVLLTTEDGLAPFISAWSIEALERLANEHSIEYAKVRKWSYADSPYYNFGGEYFQTVKQLFNQRPNIDELNDDSWAKELSIRLSAMEIAMKNLDDEGIFGINQPRENIYINVELMPPNSLNTERALRLNNRNNITDWLEEAAE